MQSLTEKYVEDVLRTEPSVEDYEKIISRIGIKEIRLLHAAMGLCTEAGEFMDMLKKHIMYGVPLDEVNLIEELGDGNWYEGIALDTLMFSMAETLHRNIAKLKKRFPEKFNEEDALNRNLEQERMVLAYEQTKKNIVHYFEHGNQNTICNQNLLSVDNATDATQFVTCVDCKNAMVAIHFNRMQ